MSFDPAFLARWRAQPISYATLARIDLLEPAQTVYAATRETLTADGTFWEALIQDAQPVHDPGAFLTSDVPLSTTRLVLADRKLGYQAPGLTLFDALVAHRWIGAPCWIYMYLHDKGLQQLRLPGVIQDYAIDAEGGTLALDILQRRDWNRTLAPLRVTREAFPHAPDESLDAAIGPRYGDARLRPHRGVWDDAPVIVGTNSAPITGLDVGLLMVPRVVMPATLVDTGRGGGPVNPRARVLVAPHELEGWSSFAGGSRTGQFMEMGGRLIPLFLPNLFNGPGGAGFELRDDEPDAWYPIEPGDVEIVANNANNPRALLDPANDFNFARLNWTNLERELRVSLQSVQEPGVMAEVYLWMAYQTFSPVNLRMEIANLSGAFDFALPAAPTPSFLVVGLSTSGTWDGVQSPSQPWNFSETRLRVFYSGTGGGSAHVWRMGHVVRFTPRQELVRSERIVSSTEVRPTLRGDGLVPFLLGPHTVHDRLPAQTEVRGKFYAAFPGHRDDAGGTHTGTPLALVKRPVDIASHLLATYGQQPLAAITQGASEFGSFVKARAALKTWNGADMELIFGLDREVDVMTAIAQISRASATWIYLSPFDDRWKAVPWRAGAPIDYPLRFRREHLSARPEIISTPDSDLSTRIRVPYAYDGFSKSYRSEVSLGGDGSNSGHRYLNLRDESVSISFVTNDRLDFTTAAALKTAVLPAGDADPVDLMALVPVALNTADPARNWIFSWGPTIVAGVNDWLDFDNGGAEISFQLPPGTYVSFEFLCQVVTTTLNFSGGFWSVTYDRATRKVTAGGPGKIRGATGTHRTQSAWASLGFDLRVDHTVGTPQVAAAEVEEELFVLQCIDDVFDLNFESGPNGLLGLRRSCAMPLGFDGLRDLIGANQYSADTPKNSRERRLKRTALRYAPRRETLIEGRLIYDDATARQLRNLVADLVGEPRLTITFPTLYAPDMQRGNVFAFDADLDAWLPFPKFGSDGSWGGKRFVCIETAQHLGPDDFNTHIVAIDIEPADLPAPGSLDPAPEPFDLYVFLVWRDARAAVPQIYAQMLIEDVDQWATDGVPVSSNGVTTTESERYSACHDGGTGLIVAFNQALDTAGQVWAQRLTIAGDPVWGPAGVAVGDSAQIKRQIVAEPGDAGSSFIAWVEEPDQLFVQKLDSNGVHSWLASPVDSLTGSIDGVALAHDGAGGCFIAWCRGAAGTGRLRVQHLSAAGTAQWFTPESTSTAAMFYNQPPNRCVPDGAGGVYVLWTQANRLFHFDSGGNEVWAGLAGFQWAVSQSLGIGEIVPDGAGGIIVLWRVPNVGGYEARRARRFSISHVDLWDAAGVEMAPGTVGTAAGRLIAVPDGTGGFIAAWRGIASGVVNVYAARVDGGGLRAWAAAGVNVSETTGSTNTEMVIGTDGAGGAVIGWSGSPAGGGFDVFAARVGASGTVVWRKVVALQPGTSQTIAGATNLLFRMGKTPQGL